MYFSSLDPEVFHSQVQLCTYPGLDMVQEGQAIMKDQWSKWDIVTIVENEATEYQSILHVDVVSINSDSTIAYDITSAMIIDHGIECESVQSESVQSANVVPDLPDINQVRAELNLLVGGRQSSS